MGSQKDTDLTAFISITLKKKECDLRNVRIAAKVIFECHYFHLFWYFSCILTGEFWFGMLPCAVLFLLLL